jgi:hypothetical protein
VKDVPLVVTATGASLERSVESSTSLPYKYAGEFAIRFPEDNEHGCHQRLVVQSRGSISYGKAGLLIAGVCVT